MACLPACIEVVNLLTEPLPETFLSVSDQVSPVYLAYPEVVAHLDPPTSAHWGNLAHLDPLAQWDHQVT